MAGDARWREAHWYYDHDYQALRRLKAGEYSPMVQREHDAIVPYEEIEGLIKALEENGFLKPRLDDRLRAEDLKITHRLMDLLDKSITKGS